MALTNCAYCGAERRFKYPAPPQGTKETRTDFALRCDYCGEWTYVDLTVAIYTSPLQFYKTRQGGEG